MRIIGGEYRGIRVDLPGNFRARPTTDMAKESLFNILANKVDFSKIKVLDLFSGTGSISFEFASRGCKEIVLVENNFVHYKHIRSVIDRLKLKDVIDSIKGDVFKYVKNCSEQFHLVFADPPYALEKIETLPEIILNSDILLKGGTLIFEHDFHYQFNKIAGFREKRVYGSVNFSFFEKI